MEEASVVMSEAAEGGRRGVETGEKGGGGGGGEEEYEDFEVVARPSHIQDDDDSEGSKSNHLDAESFKSSGSGVQPLETFVLIQQEQEALKNELISQQSLLTAGFDHLRSIQDDRNKEMCELKMQLGDTQANFEKTKEENLELCERMKSFQECRDKVDELTAKLFQAEDMSRYHEQIIQQFKTEGFVNVQPPMLTDALLAKELNDKEHKLKQAEGKILALEGTLVQEKENGSRLERENEELRHLVTALQVQLADDRSYVDELRGEVNRLRNGNSLPSPPPQCSGWSKSSSNESSQCEDKADEVFDCEKCGLRICDQRLFLKHMEGCKPSIDHID